MYLFLIPNKPPATLLEPDKWSDNCKDFLALCLQKNPDDRPSAEELLKVSDRYTLTLLSTASLCPERRWI